MEFRAKFFTFQRFSHHKLVGDIVALSIVVHKNT